MNKLETYSSIDEIKRSFDIEIINDENEFEALIKKFEDIEESGKYIYRGANDASYKMYSTSQRDYVDKGLFNKFGSYKVYLESIYEQSKSVRDGLLPKLYNGTRQILRFYTNRYTHEEANLSYNNFWAFSFMQHYGIPTPLIDFSGSFFASLFFAWDKASEVNNSYLLKDYIQINYFEKESHNNDNFESILLHCRSKIKRKKPKNINEVKEYFEEYFDFFKIPNNEKIYYISRDGSTKMYGANAGDFEIEFNISNLNIIAQEGLFIANCEERKCLEDIWNEYLPNTRLKKILIHKSLVNSIEKVLKKNVGNNLKEYFYPQEESVVNELYNNVLK